MFYHVPEGSAIRVATVYFTRKNDTFQVLVKVVEAIVKAKFVGVVDVPVSMYTVKNKI